MNEHDQVRFENANTELFDAAQNILIWLQKMPVQDRPIAKFNRLHDALNVVREAHQMKEGYDK